MTRLIGSVRITRENFASRALQLRKETRVDPRLRDAVAKIVDDVRARKDSAVRDYCMRFDGTDVERLGFRVTDSEIGKAFGKVDRRTIEALRYSMERVSRIQRELIGRTGFKMRLGGFSVSVSPEPLPSVGCYVPGGRASYASSVVMTAGVARVAGVKRVVVCTPSSEGKVGNELLAAARIAGVDEVYRVGGAQAIAAMAYGTESISPVSKIVGPGGRYVAVAKQMVSPDVPTDFYAGPTEILVYADESCPPKTAAWDLVAQAEHGVETLCGLVTLSEEYAVRVRNEMERLLPSLGRREHVEGALATGFAAVCDDDTTACRFIDAISPEHLEILTRDPRRLASKIRSAGLKLLGPFSPASASDYIVGTDHVIPTGGFSSARGPLSVLDFVKLDWTVEGSSAGLRQALPPLKALAEAEGLSNHYLSAESRFTGGGAV